jgi:NTE family protein
METSQVRSRTGPRLGLALGGGGARALAHVGVLKALTEAGIRADVVAGTSMGGIIAAAYAAGYSPRAIEAEVLRLSGLTQLVQLADRMPTLKAVFSGRRFEQYLATSFGADLRFEDLKRPLAVTAVDLNSGREVVFRSGPLVPALRATMSIPGIYAAVERDGMRLVDGGILNNVPADHARTLGADLVVAVDVLPAFARPGPGEGHAAPGAVEPLELPLALPGVRDLWESIFIGGAALTAANLERARPELVIRPRMAPSITVLLGYRRAEEPIAGGFRAMQAAIPELKRLLGAAPHHQDLR